MRLLIQHMNEITLRLRLLELKMTEEEAGNGVNHTPSLEPDQRSDAATTQESSDQPLCNLHF